MQGDDEPRSTGSIALRIPRFDVRNAAKSRLTSHPCELYATRREPTGFAGASSTAAHRPAALRASCAEFACGQRAETVAMHPGDDERRAFGGRRCAYQVDGPAAPRAWEATATCSTGRSRGQRRATHRRNAGHRQAATSRTSSVSKRRAICGAGRHEAIAGTAVQACTRVASSPKTDAATIRYFQLRPALTDMHLARATLPHPATGSTAGTLDAALSRAR